MLLPALWPVARRTEHLGKKKRLLLEAAFVLNWERNERILAQAESLILAMNGAGVTPIALKGLGHLVSGLWPHAGGRVLHDIDLLVRPEDVERAMAALGDDAAPIDDTSRVPERWAVHQHLPAMHAPGWHAAVELHTAAMGQRDSKLLPAEEIFADAIPMRLGRAEVLLPCPEHRAIHAIAHPFVSDRLYFAPALAGRDLVDLIRLNELHGTAIDWDSIQHRFALNGWGSLPAIVNHVFETLLDRDPPFDHIHWWHRADALRWSAMLHLQPLRRLGVIHAGIRDYSWMFALGGKTRRHVVSNILSPKFLSSYLRFAALGGRRELTD